MKTNLSHLIMNPTTWALLIGLIPLHSNSEEIAENLEASLASQILLVDFAGKGSEERIQIGFSLGTLVEISTHYKDETRDNINQYDLEIIPLEGRIETTLKDPNVAALEVHFLSINTYNLNQMGLKSRLATLRFDRLLDDQFEISFLQFGAGGNLLATSKDQIEVMVGTNLFELHNSSRSEVGGDLWAMWLPLARGEISWVHHFNDQLSLHAQAEIKVYPPVLRGLGDGIDSDVIEGITGNGYLGLTYELPKKFFLTAGAQIDSSFLNLDSKYNPDLPLARDLKTTVGVGVEWHPCGLKLKRQGLCK